MGAMTRREIASEVQRQRRFFAETWDRFCLWVEHCAEELRRYPVSRLRDRHDAIVQELSRIRKEWSKEVRTVPIRPEEHVVVLADGCTVRRARLIPARENPEDAQAAAKKWGPILNALNGRLKEAKRKMERRLQRVRDKGWVNWTITSSLMDDCYTTAGLVLPDHKSLIAPAHIVNPVLWLFGHTNPRLPDSDEQFLLDCALLVIVHDASVTPTRRIYHLGTYQGQGKRFDCDGVCNSLANRLGEMESKGQLQQAWDNIGDYEQAHRDDAESPEPFGFARAVERIRQPKSQMVLPADRPDDTPPYVEIDLAARTLTVGEKTITPTDKVWELLKELADAKRYNRPDLKPGEWKNAYDMLRRKIGKDNLQFVVEATDQGYKLAANVKPKGGGQIGIRKTK